VAEPSLAALPDTVTSIEPKREPVAHPCKPVEGIVKFDYKSYDIMFGVWQLDYRSCDVSALNFSRSLEELLFVTFDSKTVWPPADNLPAEYDPQQVLAWGMSPGLGIAQLHAQGVTGSGIGIALIDFQALADHVEYAGQLRHYEEAADVAEAWPVVNYAPPYGAGRGTALASLLVGQNTGIAPGADLYYFAVSECRDAEARTHFKCLAEGIRRVIVFNEQLPAERKIRILVTPIGFSIGAGGFEDASDAAKAAADAGIVVLHPGSAQFKYLLMGRSPIADPERFDSYGPELLEAKGYFENVTGKFFDQLYVPADGRTLASPSGPSDYVFVRQGGKGEALSFIAGMYALALQIRPDLTPKDFWRLALESSTDIKITHNNKNYTFGPMINPAGLIQAIQADK
jgi:hypothetical protein